VDGGAEQTESPQCEADGVEILNGADIVIKNVSWLWEDWLAQGKLHMIGGAPGDDKTTISLAWGAIISIGAQWPDGSQAPLGDVLIWSGEDDVADTLLPRFIAAGGDRRRFHVVGPVKENGQKRPFDPSKDVAKLIAAARKILDLRLVIIDPIVAAVAGDSHKASEVRRALYPFVVFAEKVGTAILGISHFAKGSQGKSPLERLLGSEAFGAAGRVVYGSAVDQGPARADWSA
jgi:putative DNA primase/helicase